MTFHKKHMIKEISTSIFVLIACLFITFLTADAMQIFSRSPVKKKFNDGVKQYNNQQYEQALQTFRELYNYPDFNPVATATHLMLVKSYKQTGLYRQSIHFGKEFLSSYPTSEYRDDIYSAMAESFVHMGQYENGAMYFAYTITQSEDEALARVTLDNLLKLCDAFLDINKVQSLVDGSIGRDEMNIFQLALLQEYILSGEMSLATTTAMELERSVLRDILQPTFQALRKAISLDADKQVAIAVIAPFSGPYSSIGKELVGGVRYALAQAEDLPNVSIVTVDNRGSDLETVNHIERIAKHQRVVAVIGPIFSENVISGAAIAGIEELPLISPTATDDGLAGLNEYIFQLSPDYHTRGKATAQYALDSLGLKLFATVSPSDKQGKSLTDAFTKEVQERGGDVVAQLWYSDKPEDLNDQWQHLREIGFDLREQYEGGIDTSKFVSDSLRQTLSDSEFVELFQQKWDTYVEDIDSSDITLKYIDGMYFPIKNSDIDYIANQFAYYNFDTQLLGNVEWYDQNKLEEYSTYLDSILIFSDYFIPKNSTAYRDFQANFRQEMQTTPTSIHLYGYDAMNILLNRIRNGHTTRSSLAAELQTIHKEDGISRVYTLDGVRQRVNQTLHVLQYSRGDLRKVAVITTGPRQIHPLQSFFNFNQ